MHLRAEIFHLFDDGYGHLEQPRYGALMRGEMAMSEFDSSSLHLADGYFRYEGTAANAVENQT